MTKNFPADHRRNAGEYALADYGWTAHFEAQLGDEERAETSPVRVMAVHRDALEVAGPDYQGRVAPVVHSKGTESKASDIDDGEAAPTIGDWLLIDETLRIKKILERRSLFKRRAAGTGARAQLIAANVDSLFIVSSCNLDFNVARLERYLALARDAEVAPLIVLTKADLTEEMHDYVARAARLMPGLLVEALDAREAKDVARLEPWCRSGQTVALLGSSGVGKSTLLNTMIGEGLQEVGAIRADDDKGRHTTTGRSLHRLRAGGWVIDTPGMRELRLTDVASGIDEVFSDIAAFARSCRFTDCLHQGEPNCAVQRAIAEGRLEADRLKRYRKLLREDARNSETLAESHARTRAFGRLTKNAARAKRDRTGF